MPRLDLGGAWSIKLDPGSQGLADRWFLRPPTDGWREIQVPSAWQSVLGPESNGVAWYQRPLPEEVRTWARPGDRRVRLRFESVATDCRVWVDGVECGRHVGDFLPFDVDITDALRRGTGAPRLSVRVDQIHAPRPPKGVVVENGHIGKGFHDVLSLQHAGLWGDVWVRSTGPVSIAPGGLLIDADPRSGLDTLSVEVDGEGPTPSLTAEIRDPEGRSVSAAPVDGRADHPTTFMVSPPRLWSPRSPNLYELTLRIGTAPEAETLSQRFGFRSAVTGGPDNSLILLNGEPLQIRGMLSWGHEPQWIAPAPPESQIREEFSHLREMGFNCLCLCMVYPPERLYRIADEMGILLWQEHPIWKSRMTPDLLPEYRRLYREYMRRDRAHPSVIIVSATCEHEAYDADLARWWWETSARMLPRTLRQIQTGFLEQTPPDFTDLYDDHVYDNCGRWVSFHKDMEARIRELPPKPFVMGETIISNGWPDLAAFRAAGLLKEPTDAAAPKDSSARREEGSPWWLAHGLRECEALEHSIERRFGAATLARFRSQARLFALDIRKFQAEVLRSHARNAGFVTNSIRDVPICRLGFQDDLGHWRFAAEESRTWLADSILILRMPGFRRAFSAGERIPCELGLSNFAPATISGQLQLRAGDAPVKSFPISAAPGEIRWAEYAITAPSAPNGLQEFHLSAQVAGISNRWSLVAVNGAASTPSPPISRVTGLDFTAAERLPEFEERSYSSGWGLPCRSWKPSLPDPALLLPEASSLDARSPIPASSRVVITTRLTAAIESHLRSGGRCILLCHRHDGGLRTKWINLWGLLPLIIESDRDPSAIIRPGESSAILTMLPLDLTRATTRALPSDDLGITEHLDPVIRYIWTHDSGVPKIADALFTARVGAGLLIGSCMDHSTPAGAWLLRRMVTHAASATLGDADRELDLRPFLAAPA